MSSYAANCPSVSGCRLEGELLLAGAMFESKSRIIVPALNGGTKCDLSRNLGQYLGAKVGQEGAPLSKGYRVQGTFSYLE